MQFSKYRRLEIAGIALLSAFFVSCHSGDSPTGSGGVAAATNNPGPTISVPPSVPPAAGPGPSAGSGAPGPVAPSSPLMASSEGIEKPTPDRSYNLTLAPSLSVSMSRNEVIGRVLRVAVSSCQALAASGAPSGVQVALFHMPTLSIATPSYTGGSTGNQYDPLVPLSTTSGQVCPSDTYVWADISVDKTVAPGTYSFTIGTLPVSLKVWNLTMPDKPTMPLYVGLGSYPLLLAHNYSPSTGVDVQGPLTLAYVNFLRAHRIEPQGQFIQNPPLNGDGTLNLDNWSTMSASFREDVMTGALAPVLTRSPTGTTYSWATTAELQGWETAIQNNASLSGAWAYLTDEPTDMPGVAARAQLVRTNAPHMKTMVTTEPNSTLLGLIDHFTVVMEFFKQPGHWMDYTQAPGYFLYGSCMAHGSCVNGTIGTRTGTPDLMLDEPDVHARVYPMVAYRLGASAALYYNSVQTFGSGNPWTSQYLFAGNGDGTLIYPGVAGTMGFTQNTPVASIRLKALRQGMFDIEYLKLAHDAGVPTNAGTLLPDQFHWSRNNADYEAMRQSIGDALGN